MIAVIGEYSIAFANAVAEPFHGHDSKRCETRRNPRGL